MTKYIHSKEILKRIGCTAEGMYAVDCSNEQDRVGAGTVLDDDVLSGIDDQAETLEIDNSDCDAEFEEDASGKGYSGVPGFMHGGIRVYRKGSGSQYAEELGIFSSDGMYRMESARGATLYPGKMGRARCLAIPQCKMMNLTVEDDLECIDHPVYVLEPMRPNDWREAKGVEDLGLSWFSQSRKAKKARSNEEGFKEFGYGAVGTHVPFDLWMAAGAVLGKALRVWFTVAGMKKSLMPTYMSMTVQEMFEAMNPGCDWMDLSLESRMHWREELRDLMDRLRRLALGFDLPPRRGTKGRHAYVMRSVLKSTFVERRASEPEEEACRSRFGSVWMPDGFKVELKASGIYDFMWRRTNVKVPSCVILRPYDNNCRAIYGVKGWRRCYQTTYVGWLINRNNYFRKHCDYFRTCRLGFDRKSLKRAFSGSVCHEAWLDDAEVGRLLRWHTPDGVMDGGRKRPSHIASYGQDGKHSFTWEMHRSLDGDPLIFKRGRKENMPEGDVVAEAGPLPAKVEAAKAAMEEINRLNSFHFAYIGRRRLSTSEAIIYGVKRLKDGGLEIQDGVNGRCYSNRHGIQSLKKGDRLRVKIDGEAVSEVDYSSLHLSMLYAMNGIECHMADLYDVGTWWHGTGLTKEEARKAVKMMVVRMINARSIVMAKMSFKASWNRARKRRPECWIGWLNSLYEAIQKAHAPIAGEFSRNRGVVLMNMDGEMIRAVCLRLARAGICALAVHDSVVVPKSKASEAKNVMIEEFRRMLNGNVKVKIK